MWVRVRVVVKVHTEFGQPETQILPNRTGVNFQAVKFGNILSSQF